MKIVITEVVDWDTTVRIGSHHYASQMLEKGHDVLWVSQMIHPLSFVTGDTKRTGYARKLANGKPGNGSGSPDLYIPFSILPCRRYKFLDSKSIAKASLRLSVPGVRRVTRRLGFDEVDVLWISNPMYAGLADILKPKVLVSRVNDLYSGFGSFPKCVLDLEKELMERANLVFATSKVLMNHVKELGREALYLPNGAEYEHFSTPAPAPEEYDKIPSPRVLYVGAIEHWFDTDMLIHAARSLPDVSMVLIGACQPDVAQELEAAGLSNIHVLGARPYTDLPSYYQHADAAIIPFKLNDLTKAVNPNKLYEYFAAGLPTVSTALPEIRHLEPLVKLVDNKDRFAAELSQALIAGKDDGLLEERLKCAEMNSWKARFNEAWELILRKLN